MADEFTHIPRARVCGCIGGCDKAKQWPYEGCVPNPIDEAWREGEQRGIDRGFWLGASVGVLAGFILGTLALWAAGVIP